MKTRTEKLVYTVQEMADSPKDLIKCANAQRFLSSSTVAAEEYDRCRRILKGEEVYSDYTPKFVDVTATESVERVLTDDGGEVDVGLFLTDEPCCYRDFVPTEKTHAKLAVITGFAWSVPRHRIQKAGENLAHRIRGYEARGTSCEVDYISAIAGCGSILSSATRIKESSRELDESMLYFFCSALFFRSFFIHYESGRFCRLFGLYELPGAGQVCDLPSAKVDLSVYDEVMNMREL